MPDLTALARLFDKFLSQIAGTTRDIEHLEAWTNSGLSNSENLPHAMQPGGHQIIHNVIFRCHRVKNLSYFVDFFFFSHRGVAKMGSTAVSLFAHAISLFSC